MIRPVDHCVQHPRQGSGGGTEFYNSNILQKSQPDWEDEICSMYHLPCMGIKYKCITNLYFEFSL